MFVYRIAESLAYQCRCDNLGHAHPNIRLAVCLPDSRTKSWIREQKQQPKSALAN